MREVLPALTGLRGVAALWVVAYHLHPVSGNALFRQGWMGVDVFFILSGFVLGHVYAGRLGRVGYADFLRRRVARIFPLHLMVMLVVGGLVFPAGLRWAGEWGLRSYLATLLLVQGWPGLPEGAWNPPAWSLSAEWLAYLLFPLLLGATQWPRRAWVALLLAGLVLGAYAGGAMLAGMPDGDGPGQLARLLRMAAEFSAGLLLLRARAAGLAHPPRWMEALGLVLLGAAVLGGWAGLAALGGFALVILCAADARSWSGRALSRAPLLFLGEISYSLYLVHAVIFALPRLAFWDALGPGWWAVAAHDLALVGLCCLVAWGSYLAIERPGRMLGRRAAAG